MTRCKCGGLLKVIAQAEYFTHYECRRCKKQWEWRELTLPTGAEFDPNCVLCEFGEEPGHEH